jgi:AraC family transcriptional regulator
MQRGLANHKFYALNHGQHLSERHVLLGGKATVYVSTHLQKGFSDLLHYHDEPHVTLIVNGGVIDKRKRSERELIPGGIMFFHGGEAHQTIPGTFPTKYITLQLDSSYLKEISFSESETAMAVGTSPDAKLNLLKLYSELILGDEFSDSSAEMLILGTLQPRRSHTHVRPAWVERVVERINDDWERGVTLKDLSEAASVHPKSISRYFPKYFGCTLGEYLRKLKVERALGLIKHSDQRLTDIALECGFFDQSHFTRTFRQMTGLLPKQFKRI